MFCFSRAGNEKTGACGTRRFVRWAPKLVSSQETVKRAIPAIHKAHTDKNKCDGFTFHDSANQLILA